MFWLSYTFLEIYGLILAYTEGHDVKALRSSLVWFSRTFRLFLARTEMLRFRKTSGSFFFGTNADKFLFLLPKTPIRGRLGPGRLLR